MNIHTILLIDDDVTIINLLSDILTHEGFNILKAYEGTEALELIEISKPDLIILDWNMPIMDGLETLKALNKNAYTQEIPVIMLTGVMTNPTNLREAFEQGAFDFIRKNFDTIELLARIRAALKFVQAHKEIVQLKNNELVRNAMKMAQHNNFTITCLQHINELLHIATDDTVMQEKISSLKSYVHSMNAMNNWSIFDDHFKTLHPDFYKKLSAVHPQLGPSELKLCALLKLNLRSKEIAGITNTTYDSIKTARTRIRKKLGIETAETLVNYLMQF